MSNSYKPLQNRHKVIRYIPHTAIDKKRWDKCISQSSNGSVYAFSWYLDILCNHQWDALIKNDYEAVFPLPWNKKWGISYIYQPFFVQQLGAFSISPPSTALVHNFLSRIPSSFRFIELNLNETNQGRHPNFQYQQRVNYKLSLQQNYGRIYQQYATNHQRNIKKGEKHELSLTSNISPNNLIQIFDQTIGKNLSDFNKKVYQRLEQLMKHALTEKQGQLWGVQTDNGHLCAGAFFMDSLQDTILLFNASDSTGRQTGAMHFLIDRFIDKYTQTYRFLDFEGSNIKSLARFYSSFGAQKTHYWRIKRNRLPWYIRWLKS